MTALPKKPRPANDQYPPASQKMSYVALSYSRWNNRATLIVAGAAVIFALAGVTVAWFNLSAPSHSRPVIEAAVQPASVAVAPVAPVAAAQTVPAFDIRLNQADLAPPDAAPNAVAQVVSALPDIGLEKSSSSKALPPVLDIKMEDEEGATVRPAPRATPHPPLMIENLKQAILYDRADEPKNAIPLYQAALAAYEARGTEDAASFDPGPVRARLAYLVRELR